MKKYKGEIAEDIEKKQVEKFLEEYSALCKKHGYIVQGKLVQHIEPIIVKLEKKDAQSS